MAQIMQVPRSGCSGVFYIKYSLYSPKASNITPAVKCRSNISQNQHRIPKAEKPVLFLHCSPVSAQHLFPPCKG